MDAMQMQELCRRYRVDSLEGLVDALIRENKTLREDIRVLLAECKRLRAFLAESHKMIDRGGFHRQPADMAGAD